MAIRKQKLRDRVAAQPGNMTAAMGSMHPAVPGTPMALPLAQVVTAPANAGGYVNLGYTEMTPLWTADGAAVPGSGPGTWDQLRAAGRP